MLFLYYCPILKHKLYYVFHYVQKCFFIPLSDYEIFNIERFENRIESPGKKYTKD